jgi:hypothetical protein
MTCVTKSSTCSTCSLPSKGRCTDGTKAKCQEGGSMFQLLQNLLDGIIVSSFRFPMHCQNDCHHLKKVLQAAVAVCSFTWCCERAHRILACLLPAKGLVKGFQVTFPYLPDELIQPTSQWQPRIQQPARMRGLLILTTAQRLPVSLSLCKQSGLPLSQSWDPPSTCLTSGVDTATRQALPYAQRIQ